LQDTGALRRALRESNIPTLLMVHTQLTHDEAFLDRFAPHLRSPFSGVPSDTPPELEEELRERLFKVLTDPNTVFHRDFPPDLMRKAMSIGVGEPVAEEFVPLLLEQMGFQKQTPRRERAGRMAPPADFKVLVIGAGLTGIVAGIKLGEAGYD